MGKYEPLRDYLAAHQGDEVQMTFGQVERLVGPPPDSAREYRAWWGNDSYRSQSIAWQAAGWHVASVDRSTCQVRLLHELARIHASFDDPNLVSRAGLVPVMALAQRAGLADLAGEHVRVAGACGVNAPVKVACVVAGMVAGADSIDDLDVLRHGAMSALFGGIRAPSTLGSFLRSFTWGNALQLGKVSRLLLAELARRTPLLPGKDVLAFVDIDSQQIRVYGHHKQGAAFGHTKIGGKSLLVRGLNALAATVSTPLAAPVIAATRLRGGSAASARGAASFASHAVRTARATGCTGILVARADSAFYSAAFTGAVRAAGAYISVTVAMNPHALAAIAAIGQNAWTPIRYPRAIWDDQLGCWVSDAEVAEVPYTAFTSKKGKAITARLIVRCVRDLNRKAAQGQDELFDVWRYHAVFTDSPFVMLQAVTVPPAATPRMLAVEFARFLGIPVMARANITGVIEAVCGVMTDARTTVVCVDEIHNLRLATRSGAEVSDTLKYFSERIPATFVYAGINVEREGLFSGTRGQQIAGRFTLIPAAPFPYAPEWQGLVATLEDALRLHEHLPGTLTGLDRYLHQRTGGMIGSLSHLIRGAAIEAIMNGSEKISRKLLDAVDLDHAAQARPAPPASAAARKIA